MEDSRLRTGDAIRHCSPSQSNSVTIMTSCLYMPHYVKTWRQPSNRKYIRYKILHCCHNRTEPRPQVTCTEIFVKFAHVLFEICERTDIQECTHTYRHRDTLIALRRTPEWTMWLSLLFLVLLSGTLCHRPYVHRPLHSDSFRVD